MTGSWIKGWRLPLRVLRGVAAPGLLLIGGSLMAGEGVLPPVAPALPGSLPPAIVTAPVVIEPQAADLASARASALAKQPSVAAAISSLQTAVQRRHAIVSLRVPTLLARDLPIRKQQAELGVQVGEAGVLSAQINAGYAVAYGYLTYLYAIEQEKVAADAVASLSELRERLSTRQAGREKERKEEKEEADLTKDILDGADRALVDSYLNVARGRQAEAAMGAERAASALREAMGLCIDAPIRIDRKALPEVCLALDKRILVELALTRRPEIAQAALGIEAGTLEIDAQASSRLLQFRNGTFAQGSDLHATPLPAGSFDNNYSPAAVGPDMPVTINGSRKNRVAVAEAYAGRANDVLARAKLLIGLETEQAFLRWVEASKRLEQYRKAYRFAQKRTDTLRAVYEDKIGESSGPRAVSVGQLIESGGQATQLRADLNKARYEALLALAQLERATAGGFCAKLDTAPERPDEVQAAKDELAPQMQKWVKQKAKANQP